MNIGDYLNRTKPRENLENLMREFDLHKNNSLYKRGIYVYGPPGSGKSYFVNEVLTNMGYDVIKYNAVENRGNIITTITGHEITDNNIMKCFYRKKQKIAIMVTEIGSMAASDKAVLADLIKLLRPKKTKKQKLEQSSMVPIICIGQTHNDKKIQDLCKGCNIIEITKPTISEISLIIHNSMTNIADRPDIIRNLANFINGDLHVLKNINDINITSSQLIETYNLPDLVQFKTSNIDTNNVICMLMQTKYNLNNHLEIINETDRATVALLWHENVVDTINSMPLSVSLPFYMRQLENICFADYIYRVTFQKQIWQFNEMSSLIKTFKNSVHYTSTFPNAPVPKPSDIRFTKVLTKYATEYGNINFIHGLCNTLSMGKRDLFSFVTEHFRGVSSPEIETELLEIYDITPLDIKRITNYINYLL